MWPRLAHSSSWSRPNRFCSGRTFLSPRRPPSGLSWESPHFGPLGRRASRHRWGERAQPLSAVCEVGPTRGHRCLTRHAADGAEVPCAPRLMPALAERRLQVIHNARDNLHLTVWLLPDGVAFTLATGPIVGHLDSRSWQAACGAISDNIGSPNRTPPTGQFPSSALSARSRCRWDFRGGDLSR